MNTVFTEINFTAFLSKSTFLKPERLNNSSAWVQHVPFAFWLIEQLKPKLFVELGVHTGISYFSFCQSVKTNNLSTLCYGVDTWEGDGHSGLYKDDIWQEVSEYNAHQYASFSYLLKQSFDSALSYFEDGSIDLLHIDGYHTYGAVKTDFENWLPKMSACGIILFHDISVKERAFGVYKLWNELKQQYKCFEFYHGFGLGVLRVGITPSKTVNALFELSEIENNNVRLAYAALGSHLSDVLKIESATTQINNLNHLSLAYANLQKEEEALKQALQHLKQKQKKVNQKFLQIKSYQQSRILELKKEAEEKSHLLKIANNTISSQQLLINENIHLKKLIQWYQHTFENRSMLGVIKDKLKRGIKNAYIGYINTLLETNRFKNKYAVTYALQYTKDNGISNAVFSVTKAFKKDGFSIIKNSRKILHKKAAEKFNEENTVSLPVVLPVENNFEEITEDCKNLSYQPKISIIFPTYNTKPELLKAAIESVKNQIYPVWEICIVDDASTCNDTKALLLLYSNEDKIRVEFAQKNEGIAEASNKAIHLSTGEFIALMDHDDELTKDALYWIVKELNEHPNTDILYTDECKINEQGERSDYFFKPDWSPELLYNMMYIGHLTIYRKKLLENKVGFFRKEYDYSQDYDLILRAVEHTNNIRHVKKVLYQWRITEGSSSQGDKPFARISNLAALKDAAKRRGIDAEVIELPTANRLKINTKGFKKVSIIIPTDSFKHLKESVESILNNTTYPQFEIIAVTNSGLIKEMKEEYHYSNLFFATYDKPYNFSDKCNLGAQHASGTVLIFYNDDVRPLHKDWIENLIEYLELPDIGGVSPKLLYENDTIQYAGMATGVRNLTGTTFHAYHKNDTSYINFPQLVRNISILSGACLAMHKNLFLQIGGFDALNTPSSHSDVDLSFKIMEAGYRCLYTPYSYLQHIGHLSLLEYEKKEIKKKDKADIFLLKRWVKYLSEDPYFTQPMKNFLYHDSPEYYQLHAPFKQINFGNKGDVLLVSHDLSLSGAPIMLYDTSKVLLEMGYYVVVICAEDGPLRKMYQQVGITVIIDELLLKQHHSFKKFAQNFDYLICNTIVTWPVVKQIQQLVTTIWWIQEAQVINSFLLNEDCATTLKSAKHLVGVSDYSISFIKNYNKKVTKILNACYDINKGFDNIKQTKNDKIIFSLIGSIEPRKGQDILIKALENIEPHLLQKVEVRLIGRVIDQNFFKTLLPKTENLPFVKLLGPTSHQQSLRYLYESDVVLNISRDDPFPVVLVEAMCLGKPCLTSSHTGLAELIEDGKNGFVFKSEDAEELSQKIIYILSNTDKLKELSTMSRQTYNQHLTIDLFKNKLENYIRKVNAKEELLMENNNPCLVP